MSDMAKPQPPRSPSLAPSSAQTNPASLVANESQLRVGQVTLLYQSLLPALLVTLCCAVALVVVEWDVVPHGMLLTWLVAMLVITAGRGAMALAFRRSASEVGAIDRWERGFLAGATLAGFGWGATSWTIFPESSPPHQIFLAFVLGGISAGAASTMAAQFRAFLCFAVPMLTSIALRFLSSGGSQASAMTLYVIAFAGLIVYVALQNSRTMARSLTLQFENAALLGAERARSERVELRHETLLMSARHPLVHSGDLQQAIPVIAEQAAKTFPVERASIWLFDKTQAALHLQDLYEAAARRHSGGTCLPVDRCPFYFETIVNESHMIDVSDIKRDPRVREFVELYFVPLGIGALLDAPILRDGQVVGILCLEHVGGARSWTTEERAYAGSLATMVTLALEAAERRQFLNELESRVRDRTGELQAANEALRRTSTHLQTVIHQSPLAIIELDTEGRVTSWNAAATGIFGWTDAEVVGRELPYVLPNEEEQSDLIWKAIMAGDHQQGVELLRRRKDGSLVDVSFWGSEYRDPDGRVTGSIGFLIDSTERKRLETQFRQAQKMEAVGRLAGGIAHDFNNLLTVINGYSALLLDRLAKADPLHGLINEILLASQRAADLTKQLLAFSRQQVLSPRVVDLNESLRAIASLIRRLIGEDIELTICLGPDLRPIYVDTGQIGQVVMNLAVNARDAMPDGGTLTITTENFVQTPEMPLRHPTLIPGEYVHLMVRDIGQGMTPEVLSHLFEPFYTTKQEGKGTGLGLATVYGIMKQSRGFIFVESAPGQGTTFHLYFPCLKEPAVVETVASPACRAAGSEQVLVIEDQDAVRRLLVEALKGYGYEVLEASNGEEGLRVAAALPKPVHVLLTDVIMPRLTGPLVAERLRAYWPGLKVLFMSGYTDRVSPAFLSIPGTAFIQKPFLPTELAAQLRSLLDQQS